MKRLISILVLVAMMLTSFAATISAVADEIVEGGETETPVVETEKTYNVNWKELVENGTMRAQWAYERVASQNNFEKKYKVNATETALLLTPTGGENRSYYSEVMFDITADTQYEYVFKADKTNDDCADAGVIFAWAADANAFTQSNRPPKDDVDDIYPGIAKGPYSIMANWGKKTEYKVHYGAPYDEYIVFGTGSKATLTNVKVDDEGFATYKIVYNGLQVKMYVLDATDAWVEFFADKTMTLVEGSKIAFGLTTWSPSHTNLKDCVVTAKNEAAVAAINAALTADKTAYDAKLAEAAAFVQADWLSADWAKFAAKMADAKAMANAAKYKYELEYAMAKIDVAMKTLNATKANIKPTLEATIAEADAIVNVPENQALYTETSWGRMTAALEAAKTTAADEAATQAAIVAAYNVLLATKKGLLTKELAAKNVYNVNWKYLVEKSNMEDQWYSDVRNDYKNNFEVIATNNSIASNPINGGDVRGYYTKDVMLTITENTYYEYEFLAKNSDANHTGYAGVIFAFNDIKGSKYMPYFFYGAFQNDSDKGDCADIKVQFGHQDDEDTFIADSTGAPVRETPVLKEFDADDKGNHFGKYKVIYDGFTVTFYAMGADDQWIEMFADYDVVLPATAKVALGVYSRDGVRTVVVKDAKLSSYNEAAAEILVNTATAAAIKNAEAEIALNVYTPATVQAVKDAMAVVKAIKADTPAAEVDAAIAALENAINGLKKADKTALIAAIEAANAKIADKTAADFEEKYYTPFAAALATAIAANDNVNSTQEEVDAALAELVKTTKYLTLAGQACLIDLDEALAAYAALKETDYKPNSWATLADPLAIAEALKAKELTNADQEAVDAAVVALNDAIAALVKRANFNALNAIINRAEGLDKTDYTADSWNIEAALEAAKLAAENFNLDQADVDAAHKALNDAINALVTWRTNVLAIKPADDYQVNDTVSYPNPDWYNKITDMAYHGLGNVFYYDYHKFVAQQGIVPGTKFDKSLGDTGYGMQGSSDHTIRLGTNVSGNGSNRVTDGVKEGGTDLSHRAMPISINGKVYGHVFGFAFLKAPTVDSIAVYLPTDTKIVSIDVYGAVLTKDAAGNTLYGKADKAAITSDADGVQCEDATTTKKIYLGTINVPAAEAGAANILAAGDLAQAMKVDYIYFALTMAEGTGANAYYGIKEIELFGLNDGETVEGKAAPNFAAVNAAMSAFYDCVEADYTVDSWNNVKAVIAQYAATIINLKADQADVDAAAAAIDAAVKALIANPADWSALDAAISTGSAFAEDKFTPITYAPFKAAYDAAVALRAAANVPQTAVNKALAALTAAIEAIEERADFTALKAALEEAKKLVKEEWNGNAIAWKMFENSITAAEAFLQNINTTQAEVDKVTADLVSRRADLVKVEKPATPENNETEAPKETTAPQETEAPKATESSKATETEAPAADEEGCGGCGSSAAISAIALVSVIGTAVVIKKKED